MTTATKEISTEEMIEELGPNALAAMVGAGATFEDGIEQPLPPMAITGNSTEQPTVRATARDFSSAIKIIIRHARGKIRPIYGCVLLAVDGDEIWLHAYDGSAYIKTRLLNATAKDATEPWSIAIPATIFKDLIAAMEADQFVWIKADFIKQQINIRAGTHVSNLKCLAGYDFPIKNDYAEFIVEHSLDTNRLLACFARVAHTASDDPSKPNLMHTYMDKEVMASTNGYALSVTNHPFGQMMEDYGLDQNGKERTYLLLPPELLAIAPVVCGNWDTVRLKFDAGGNAVAIETPDTMVVTPTMATTYPDWRTIVPKQHTVRMLVKRAPILKFLQPSQNLDAMNGVGKDATSVRFTVKPDGDKTVMHLGNSVLNGTTGDLAYTFEVMQTSDKDAELSFRLSSKYLGAALSSAAGDDIELDFQSSTRPLVVKQLAGEDFAYWVIMPMADKKD